MPNVVFVAPFFLEATTRFIRATANLAGVRLGLISQQPLDGLAPDVQESLATHVQVADALDPQQLVPAAAAIGRRLGSVDRVMGALEHLQVPLAEVREALGVSGMSSAVAHSFRDKARMKSILRQHGIPCARHCLAEDADAARRFAAEVGFPLVLKPPAGAGAIGTVRVQNERQLDESLAMARPVPGNPTLLEEFMTGAEHSFDTVSIGGKAVWHSLTHYLPTPLEALENPWIQWCVLLPREIDHPRYDDIRAVAFRAIEVLGMETGLTHMEWFRRPDGSVAVSEVAARPPGAQIIPLMSHAHEMSFYTAWARLMAYGEFDIPERRFAAGAAFLRGQGAGRVRAVHGLEQAQQELGSLVVEATLPRLGQPRSSSYEGEGSVVLCHPETEVVERGLHRLISLVRVEIE